MANNEDAGTGKLVNFSYNVFTLCMFLIAWTVLSWLLKSLFFPTPWVVFKAFIELAINLNRCTFRPRRDAEQKRKADRPSDLDREPQILAKRIVRMQLDTSLHSADFCLEF